ncbi:DNA-cytosine methyltransferase [Pseudoalteromonas luteoviolacea CPMOR-1]|uniref:Methyltransferase n=1 Tax=Pseudoalteromonas luteoviolacea CPMOR-1 TaxID=1365248 RepID=A0A167LRG0_9GAMM|nr:site-specific DNA-methyltransferase [Pseudoalteromonas luteoviolacea]KZN65069.1 DNA-cytosine methyltransferase [Pseudoalteromonas luteoviolacea CPMOR-1]
MLGVNLFQGDCLQLLDLLPDNSIDLICADMPYGTTQCKWDTQIDLTLLWPKLKRVAKDRAAIILFAQTPFDKVLGCSNLEMLRYEWIWEKSTATGFFNAKKMPLKAHENVLVFYSKPPIYNPQKTSGHPRKTASRKGCKSECYGKEVKKVHYDSTERFPRSVQKFTSDKYKASLHPTQKPLSLLEYIVRTYSNEGDHVLDFCMGSGTAGAAAQIQNRQFTGFELNREYFEKAKQRIETAIDSKAA